MGSSTTSTPKAGTYAGAEAGGAAGQGKLGANNNYVRAALRDEAVRANFGVGGEDDPAGNNKSARAINAADTATVETEADIVALEARKNVASGKTFVVAGQDNTTTADYTATGVTATSIVVGAFWTADAADGVTAVTGTITPGVDKITVDTGADLSAGKHIVFTVIL